MSQMKKPALMIYSHFRRKTSPGNSVCLRNPWYVKMQFEMGRKMRILQIRSDLFYCIFRLDLAFSLVIKHLFIT